MGKITKKILKQLTQDNIKKEVKLIQKVELPSEIQRWVKEYEKIGERDLFFWKWLYSANRIICFPEIPQKYRKSLRETKTLFNMFLALLDDVADKNLNKRLLNELLKVPFESKFIKTSHLSQKERRYLNCTKKLWGHIVRRMRKYPKYRELRDVFEFDVRQLLNAMKYAYLVNKNPYLINQAEYWMYLSHNMQAVINLMFDLMCLSRFNNKKIGLFREIAWEAQKMARIGNWISTWEREIKDKDFTSGVFAYAIERGAITPNDLSQTKRVLSTVRKIRFLNIEKPLLSEWEKSYKKMRELGRRAGFKNMKTFLKGMERLLFMHMSSKGFK